jgi:signal transduction histidine kinase
VTETVFLQIVQEALHNVWRHSRARAVDVAIERLGAATVLRVTDDGIGFDPRTVTEAFGITAMRASAAVLGGTLAVVSGRGGGTVVTASLGGVEDEPPPLVPAPPPPLRVVRND